MGEQQPFRLLNSKFRHGFDEVFRSEGIRVIRAPVQAPNANAHAERWVRTVRTDCLDRILIHGRPHLEHLLRVYRQHHNKHRPRRSAPHASRRSRPNAARDDCSPTPP
jgi:putative transposase